MVEGLGESVKKKWSGDIDLADGELQRSYDTYKQRLNLAETIGLPPRNSREDTATDLQCVKASISNDLETISVGEMHGHQNVYT